jgi:hypothetical protein
MFSYTISLKLLAKIGRVSARAISFFSYITFSKTLYVRSSLILLSFNVLNIIGVLTSLILLVIVTISIIKVAL